MQYNDKNNSETVKTCVHVIVFSFFRRRENAAQHGHGPVNTNGPQGARGPGQALRERERSSAPGKRRAVQLQGPITAGPRDRLPGERTIAEETRRRQLVNILNKKNIYI